MANETQKVIIGTHGLANKSAAPTLTSWWKASLVEGLNNIGVNDPQFEFRLAYWADLLYKNPLHSDENFSFDALYNTEPYIKAKEGELRKHRDWWFDNAAAAARGIGGTTVDLLKQHFGMNSLADWVLGKLAKDLAFYYDPNQELKDHNGNIVKARTAITEVVQSEVRKANAEDKQIMLIGHSMGSVVAYDSLRQLGREEGNLTVSHFVTIGSPLGLPHVKGKIIEERERRYPDDPQVRTPTIVTADWSNFADRRDPVAADVHLRDDYQPNRQGVAVRDDVISNDYHTIGADGEQKHNHHKSYGYLRTPEMAEHVKKFLGL